MSPVPPWLVAAIGELGVTEVPGVANNPRILEYHATTMLRATTDEVPWCSAFANWCMVQAGIRGTGSAAARDWLPWGQPTQPRLGAIAVFQRSSNPAFGHVGFLLDEQDGQLLIISGNTGNRVCIKPFGRSRLLGLRWPS